MITEQNRLRSSRVFRRIGKGLPKTVVVFFKDKLTFAGVREEVQVWIGKKALLAFFVGAIALLSYLIYYNPATTIQSIAIATALFCSGFFVITLLSYLGLYFKIVDRTAAMERVLPDFLLLTVSNLRAGVTPFTAFVHAAIPEFGPLYEEVTQAAAKTGGSTSLVEVLNEISNHFDSEALRRTVMLFAKGIRSGGQLAKLLTSSAEEVRRIQELRAELTTATRTYSIFLGFIVVIVMPFLLAVSTHFVTIFFKLQAETTTPEVSLNVPSFSGKILLNPDQIGVISVGTLLLTCIFVSGLVGIITRGKVLYGAKYLPLYTTGSWIFYFIAKTVVGAVLAGFAG